LEAAMRRSGLPLERITEDRELRALGAFLTPRRGQRRPAVVGAVIILTAVALDVLA
jgi:hypothetical protein